MNDAKRFIAKFAGALFKEGDFVNLGIGIPDFVPDYMPKGVILHAENGLVGYGKTPEPGKEDRELFAPGGQLLSAVPGTCAIDSTMSFTMIRGGHLTATVLGALEVDEEGNLANWSMPGRMVGMGGAMDLVNGAKQVIAVMEHTTKEGKPKLLKRCTMLLTGRRCVTKVITELCMIDVLPQGLLVTAMAPGVSREELISKTEARLSFADTVAIME
jgi:acetate CoA/acetoacetate CoA-transferase beta subunit